MITKSKKGFGIPSFLLLAIILFVGIMLYYLVGEDIIKEKEITGASSASIYIGLESVQKSFFYLDTAANLAVNQAYNQAYKNIAEPDYQDGEKKYSVCGYAIFPVILPDNTECLPVIENEYVKSIKKIFIDLVNKNPDFYYDYSDFQILEKDNGKINIVALNEVSLPLFSKPREYAYQTKEKKSRSPYEETSEGYISRPGLVLEKRQKEPNQIILTDSYTLDINTLYDRLYDSDKSVNYAIDKDGTIYEFIHYNGATEYFECETKNCDTNQESIVIAMISCSYDTQSCPTTQCYTGENFMYTDKCYSAYTEKQTKALTKLISEMSIKAKIPINNKAILMQSQADTTRKEPTPFFKDKKARIIRDAQILTDSTKQSENPAMNIQGAAVAGPTEQDILRREPTYQSGVITATVYYTPDCSDQRLKNNGWYSGETDARGFCYIHPSKRGFYEEVKCQGSGVCDGKVYHHSKIRTTKELSTPMTSVQNGITATQTDPQPKKTVAVNNQKGTQCYVPYGTSFYAYFGPNNAWNGFYTAEDTGSAFGGQCKMDFYAGVGETSKDEALKHINEKPEIYIIGKDNAIISATNSASITGFINTNYAISIEKPENKIKIIKEDLENIMRTCSNSATKEQKYECVNNQILNFNKNNKSYQIGQELKNPDSASTTGSVTRKTEAQEKDGIKESRIYIYETLPERATKQTEPQIIQANEKEIILQGEVAEKVKDIQIGDYIQVQSNEPGSIPVGLPEQIVINPAWVDYLFVEDLALQLMSCTENQDDCECKVQYKGIRDKINFEQNRISTGDFQPYDSAEISYNLDTFESEFNKKIGYDSVYVFEKDVSQSKELIFKKTSEQLELVSGGTGLQACTLSTQYIPVYEKESGIGLTLKI